LSKFCPILIKRVYAQLLNGRFLQRLQEAVCKISATMLGKQLMQFLTCDSWGHTTTMHAPGHTMKIFIYYEHKSTNKVTWKIAAGIKINIRYIVKKIKNRLMPIFRYKTSSKFTDFLQIILKSAPVLQQKFSLLCFMVKVLVHWKTWIKKEISPPPTTFRELESKHWSKKTIVLCM
jgi:hypothetical protein